jgi:DNA repair protein RecO (recombination protein O)
VPIRVDQAIVLRVTEFSESSQIVWLFTERSGQVRLMAKGVRRSTKARTAVGLDLLECGEAGFDPARPNAELGTLTEWALRDAHLGLRRSLPHLLAGLYAAELVASFTLAEDPHPQLFETFKRFLAVAADEASSNAAESAAGAAGGVGRPDSDRVAALVVRFQTRLLEAIGYAPRLDACVQCGRAVPSAEPAFFSSGAGGLLCRDCEMPFIEKRRLPRGLRGEETRADPLAWFDLLEYHLTALLGRPLRSSGRLREALARGATHRSGRVAPGPSSGR